MTSVVSHVMYTAPGPLLVEEVSCRACLRRPHSSPTKKPMSPSASPAFAFPRCSDHAIDPVRKTVMRITPGGSTAGGVTASRVVVCVVVVAAAPRANQHTISTHQTECTHRQRRWPMLATSDPGIVSLPYCANNGVRKIVSKRQGAVSPHVWSTGSVDRRVVSAN